MSDKLKWIIEFDIWGYYLLVFICLILVTWMLFHILNSIFKEMFKQLAPLFRTIVFFLFDVLYFVNLGVSLLIVQILAILNLMFRKVGIKKHVILISSIEEVVCFIGILQYKSSFKTKFFQNKVKQKIDSNKEDKKKSFITVNNISLFFAVFLGFFLVNGNYDIVYLVPKLVNDFDLKYEILDTSQKFLTEHNIEEKSDGTATVKIAKMNEVKKTYMTIYKDTNYFELSDNNYSTIDKSNKAYKIDEIIGGRNIEGNIFVSVEVEGEIKWVNYKALNRLRSINITDITASSSYQYGKTTYPIENVIDNNIKTVWFEGAVGNGKDEKIIIKLDEEIYINYLTILNGYADSEALYKANNRIKEVSVSVDDKIIGNFELFGYDKNSFGFLSFIPIKEMGATVEIVILDVDEIGTNNHDDTCVTEISLVGLAEE